MEIRRSPAGVILFAGSREAAEGLKILFHSLMGLGDKSWSSRPIKVGVFGVETISKPALASSEVQL